MLRPAIGQSLAARKLKVSRLNTENVVNPPQMPVITNWRVRALTMSLPPGSVPVCGATLKFMLKVLPLTDVLSRVLNGSGECAKITWRFLGLSMPAWVLIAALVLGAWGLWVNWRRAPQPGLA